MRFTGVVRAELLGEFAEGGGEFGAEGFGAGEVELRVGDGEGFEPARAAPAVGEGEVFQPVDVGVAVVGEAGFQRAEEVVGLPAVGEGAQGEARELGERVVGDGFAAVEEEGDAVAGEDAAQRDVVVVEGAEDDGAVAVTTAGADVTEDFAGGREGLGLGVGAEGEAEGMGDGVWRLGGGGWLGSLLRGRLREVLECASPLALLEAVRVRKRRRAAAVQDAGARFGASGRRGPAHLQLSERRGVTEAAVGGGAGEFFDGDFAVGQGLDARVAIAVGAADAGPEGEPAFRVGSVRVEAEGERGGAAEREDGAEEVEFLRGHFGEAVEPEPGDGEWGMGNGEWGGAQELGGEVEELVGVADFALLQPLVVGAEEVVEVVEFVAERGVLRATGGKAGELGGRELVTLEFAEELAELAGETGESGGGAEDAERGVFTGQQRAENHHAALVVEEFGDGGEGLQEPVCEAVEGDDLQARVASEAGVVEELAFELEGGLLRGEQEEGRAVGRALQLGADVRKAAPGLAAAGGAEEEVDAHLAMVGGGDES